MHVQDVRNEQASSKPDSSLIDTGAWLELAAAKFSQRSRREDGQGSIDPVCPSTEAAGSATVQLYVIGRCACWLRC